MIIITNPINQGINHSTTLDWLNAIKDMKLTVSGPSIVVFLELIEPGEAVNLPRAQRIKMSRAEPGIYTAPEPY